MAKFTLSQLDPKGAEYSLVDTDLALCTIGTATPFLSSVKISLAQLDTYFASANAHWSKNSSTSELTYTLANVGIGTTDPSDKLEIAGGSLRMADNYAINWGGNSILKHTGARTDIGDNSSASALVLKSGKAGIGAVDPIAGLEVVTGSATIAFSDPLVTTHKWIADHYSADGSLRFYKATPTGTTLDTTLVLSGSNVGIGTTAPTSPLHVESNQDRIADFSVTDVTAYIQLRDSLDSLYISSDSTKGSFGGNAGAHANNLNIVLSSGNVGIGNTTPYSKLSIHGGTENDASGYENRLAFYEHADGSRFRGIGMYYTGTYGSPTAYGVGIWTSEGVTVPTNTSPKLVINDAGQVGIGTVAPDEKLHVVGKAKIGDSVYTEEVNLTGVGTTWTTAKTLDTTKVIYLVSVYAYQSPTYFSSAVYVLHASANNKVLTQIGTTGDHNSAGYIQTQVDSTNAASVNLQVKTSDSGFNNASVEVHLLKLGSY